MKKHQVQIRDWRKDSLYIYILGAKVGITTPSYKKTILPRVEQLRPDMPGPHLNASVVPKSPKTQLMDKVLKP